MAATPSRHHRATHQQVQRMLYAVSLLTSNKACKCHEKNSFVMTVRRDELAVVACSALKQKYRDVLSGKAQGSEHFKDVAFVSIKHMQFLQTLLYKLLKAGMHSMTLSTICQSLLVTVTDNFTKCLPSSLHLH